MMPDDTRESRTVEAALRVCGAVGTSVGICRHLSRVGGVTVRVSSMRGASGVVVPFCIAFAIFNSYDNFKFFLYCNKSGLCLPLRPLRTL